jgi:hypothetical protein
MCSCRDSSRFRWTVEAPDGTTLTFNTLDDARSHQATVGGVIRAQAR